MLYISLKFELDQRKIINLNMTSVFSKIYGTKLTCCSNSYLFGPKRDELTGQWRKLHNEELYLNSSPNIIRQNKSRRMR
jgi:hypothetical protein